MITVTLHVSVWVEIQKFVANSWLFSSHAPRERVSWNVNTIFVIFIYPVTLHVSVWVEISLNAWERTKGAESRSTWACELKFDDYEMEIGD